MSIRKKLVEAYQKAADLQFDTTAIEGVKIKEVEEIYKKLKPIFKEVGIMPVPNIQYNKEYGIVQATIQWIDEGTEDITQTIQHPILTELWGGGNITLCAKYAYVLMFMISTKDDVALKTPEEIRAEAFKTPVKEEQPPLIKQPKVILLDTTKIDTVTDTVESLIAAVNSDQNIPQLEVKPEEKKEPEPSETLMNKINEGDWKIKVELKNCLSEVTVVKTMDKLYMNLGTSIYGHPDNALCPINPYTVIDKLPHRSNLKIRRPIVQYRVFGEEAFWKQMSIETGLKTREEIEALIALPKEEPKKEEEVKPVIHELNLDFDIPEHMGADRDEEICFRLLANLRKFGVNQFAILYGLKNMTNKPEMDMAGGDDDVVLRFLSKASKLQIIEMIKLAKSAG